MHGLILREQTLAAEIRHHPPGAPNSHMYASTTIQDTNLVVSELKSCGSQGGGRDSHVCRKALSLEGMQNTRRTSKIKAAASSLEASASS